jgi:hypothetical protein
MLGEFKMFPGDHLILQAQAPEQIVFFSGIVSAASCEVDLPSMLLALDIVFPGAPFAVSYWG